MKRAIGTFHNGTIAWYNANDAVSLDNGSELYIDDGMPEEDEDEEEEEEEEEEVNETTGLTDDLTWPLYAVIEGNPLDGFTVTGPFNSSDLADSWRENSADSDAWIVTLGDPT